MSRFWAGEEGSSSSEDSSDASSSESSSSGDDNKGKGGAGGGAGENRWVMSDDDSDSEDEVRVVKSGKDRAYETFQNHISSIRTAMKTNNWKTIQSEFDDLTKAIKKSKTLLEREGGVPKFYVRSLCDVEDFTAKCLEEKTKMNPGNQRSLNRMKLTVRKYRKEYGKIMEEYRKNPIVSSSEESEEESDDDDDDESSDSGSSSSDEESGKETKKVVVKKKKEKVPAAKKVSSDSDGSSSSSSDDSSSDSDSDESSSSSSGSESGSDDEQGWASDSSSSSDSSTSSADPYAQLKGRARWLKKTTDTSKKEVKSKEEKAKLRLEVKALAARDKAQLAAEKESSSVSKALLPVDTLTPSMLDKKVKEIVSMRGRKNTDKAEVVRHLEALARLSLKFQNPRVEVPILMNLITAQFDLQRTMDDFMDIKSWKSCARQLNRISDVLADEKWKLGVLSADDVANDMMLLTMSSKGNIMKSTKTGDSVQGAVQVLGQEETLTNPHTGEVETVEERAERLRKETEANMSTEEYYTIPVVGSLASFVNRLDEEYIKSLQRISPHTIEFVMRLRDEGRFVSLLTKVQNYYTRIESHAEAAELAQLRVEHLYYRHDTIAAQVDKATLFYNRYGEMSMLHPASLGNDVVEREDKFAHPAAIAGKPSVEDEENVDYSALISQLCTYVYKHASDRSRTRGMLCHIYHHALHDRFLEAKDLLLMSHLQDTISDANDTSTMILFNRMMVTLGLAAFRLGKIWDAHQCLSDICSSRVRELLAQGLSISRFNDKTPEQEKAEKRRLVPYHQHIHLDLLEAAHLISAMLLEIPNMAYQSGNTNPDTRRRVISRTFRKHFDIYDRQVFNGPPEQTRDHVVCASKILLTGDWQGCVDLLTNLDVWQLIPGENSVENIKEMLISKIKNEGLRTYLFAFSHQYDSLSLSQLCNMFSMSKNEVHCVVSKMMIHGEIAASWDQPTETIVLRKSEPTQLQILALQFADKAVGLVDANERLLDAKSGGMFGYGGGKEDNWKDNRGGKDNWKDNRGGRGGQSWGNNQNGGGGGGYYNRNQSGGGNRNYAGGNKGGRQHGGGGRNGGGRGRGGRGRGGGRTSSNRW